MIYTKDDCIRETKQHSEMVSKLIHQVIEQLKNRAADHDKSKIESPELETFVEYTPKLKTSTYGSEEYKGFLKDMQIALTHHYENNRHHPEHFEDGIKGMDLIDLVEMFCDWKAATLRHDDGDIMKSIKFNKNRFNYSDDIEQILKNTVKVFN